MTGWLSGVVGARKCVIAPIFTPIIFMFARNM